MKQALRLARRGWGQTSPNPMVGAVMVSDDQQVVGRGFHRRAGEPHAEVLALRKAEGNTRGSTLYINLEPCSSTGRTPPCTEAIIAAGVGRVVIGCQDPNPDHAGRGLARLEESGIEVTTGVEEVKCRRLNEAFFCWIKENRPFVILKMAMTLDGKIATAAGDSKWITGGKARGEVQKLRRWADAIMVGGETVRRDNPRLDVREPEDWSPQPRPIIYSRRGDFSADFNLWKKSANVPEIISPASSDDWRNTMHALAVREITALLIEGGGELAAAALNAGIVDKVMFFIAPKILGGRGSRPAVGGENPESLARAWNLDRVSTRRIGEDVLFSGYVKKQPD